MATAKAEKKKEFCPIMTIGFDAPKGKASDPRLCHKDCMWYDHAEETCKIVIIAERLEYIEAAFNGEVNYETEEPIGFDEDVRDLYDRFK